MLTSEKLEQIQKALMVLSENKHRDFDVWELLRRSRFDKGLASDPSSVKEQVMVVGGKLPFWTFKNVSVHSPLPSSSDYIVLDPEEAIAISQMYSHTSSPFSGMYSDAPNP